MTDHTDIVERLSACADDPMWANHCEMSKATARKAAAEITRLRAEAEALRKDKAQLVEALIHLRKWADWYGNADHAARGQLPLPPSGDVELTEDIAAALKPNE